MSEETEPKRYVVFAKGDFFGDGKERRFDMNPEVVVFREEVPLMWGYYSNKPAHGRAFDFKCADGEITCQLQFFVRTQFEGFEKLYDQKDVCLSGLYGNVKKTGDENKGDVIVCDLREVVILVKEQFPVSRD